MKKYIFVLWGYRFEEATAAIFVTHLRQAGLLVKVVGLDARHISGANGLTLLPDLTLGKALPLATQAICVIVPHPSSELKRLTVDPRLQEFMRQARANAARFIIKSSSGAAMANRHLFFDNDGVNSNIVNDNIVNDNIVTYPDDDEDLVGFVRILAQSLTEVGP
ncbi:MAG: DJ-1/PfpI family protein [Gammaproteobacteria bacterium]|nr:DJ-1/PfpI family protein [Gammaproteobacteria bacterium]